MNVSMPSVRRKRAPMPRKQPPPPGTARRFPLLAMGLSLTLLAVVGCGSSAAAEQEIEAEARQLAETAVAHLQEADTAEVEIRTTVLVTAEGMRQEMESVHQFALDRPDRLALRLQQGIFGDTLVVDGEHTYSHMPMLDRYTEKPAPKDVDQLLTPGAGDPTAFTSGTTLPMLSPLLSREGFDTFMAAVVSVTDEGEDAIDGEPHRLLRFEVGGRELIAADDLPEAVQDDLPRAMEQDWSMTIDVWLTQDDPPLVRRIVPDLAAFQEAAMAEAPEGPAFLAGMEMQWQIDLLDWRVNEPVEDELFAFDPPAGAEKVEQMFDFDPEDFAADTPAAPADELVGEPAPPFELDLLDGGQVALADHLGEDIVILDFWATWCGPCIRAMPMLIDVAERYQDKGVVFYGVNLREQPDVVENFMQEQGWDFAVPMDRAGEVGEAYHVHGIPQTVIIDGTGNVALVHVGFDPNLDELLSGRIDELLDGDAR